MPAAGRLVVFGSDETGRDVVYAVAKEVEARWEVFLALYVCTEVVLQL